MDKRRLKGELTKKAILEATQEIISQEGLQSLSTRMIARKANISQSSIYHHFSGVDEILFASLEARARQHMELEHIRKFDNLHDYFCSLLDMTDLVMQKAQSSCGYFAIFEKAMRDETFRQRLVTMGQQLTTDLKKNIQTIYSTSLDSERLELFVFAFSMFREGYMNHLQLYQGDSPYENPARLARMVMQLFRNAIISLNATNS